jgi:hypothetical protein
MDGGRQGDEVIRIVQVGDRVTATYKRFLPSTQPGFLSGRAAIEAEKAVTAVDFAKIKGFVTEQDFFAAGNEPETLATGGPYWIVEVYDGRDYHAAFVLLSFTKPVIQNLVRLAADMSGIKLQIQE